VVHEVIQVMLVLTEIADLMVGCCTELKDTSLQHPPLFNILLPVLPLVYNQWLV
jgi:hypothetical protein